MDCGSARCRKERLLFRRELMTWSKKVPYMIGKTLILRYIPNLAKTKALRSRFNSIKMP